MRIIKGAYIFTENEYNNLKLEERNNKKYYILYTKTRETFDMDKTELWNSLLRLSKKEFCEKNNIELYELNKLLKKYFDTDKIKDIRSMEI